MDGINWNSGTKSFFFFFFRGGGGERRNECREGQKGFLSTVEIHSDGLFCDDQVSSTFILNVMFFSGYILTICS